MDKGWQVFEYESFNEVVPVDDSKDHFLGDECWCDIRTEVVEGGKPDLLIVHSSADGREKVESILDQLKL